MPLINRFLVSRKKIKKTTDCKLPLDIDSEINIRNKLNFGADQVRILLFRECEWRGRKLLFDSITAGKNNGSNSSAFNETNVSCPRSGNGLPHEVIKTLMTMVERPLRREIVYEKEVCDNVNLLSEMVFGTVAMTYRGALFKIHTLDSPRCVMCTKVFPAPDHNTKQSGKYSDDTLLRNIKSSPSSGNISAQSLRKSSMCSSTCSGWDIDLPTYPTIATLGTSKPSYESHNSTASSTSFSASSHSSLSSSSSISSGFGSFPSLRRRWLRVVSTSLNHSEYDQIDEIIGFQSVVDTSVSPGSSASTSTSGNSCNCGRERHKTKLGLTIIIKLTPGREEEMELKLFEHASQLEAILNRLCYTCMNTSRGKVLVQRLHQASIRYTFWLLQLLIATETSCNLSIWHEIILNNSVSKNGKAAILCNSFQNMCQLLNMIDTKSTNFFLSTVVTAVLTYHLGWVNTVISFDEKTWLEDIKKKYPCNPLWMQLSDLYGTLANPKKCVHTVIAGDIENSTLINGILTFLSYFIRSTLVKKRTICRDSPDDEFRKAISIIERKHMKSNSLFFLSSASSSNPSLSLMKHDNCDSSLSKLKTMTDQISDTSLPLKDQVFIEKKIMNNNVNIPRLNKTRSFHKNLNFKDTSIEKLDDNYPVKLESSQDDLDDSEKGQNNTSPVKIVISSEKKKSKALTLNEFEEKPIKLINSQVLPINRQKSISSSIISQDNIDEMKELVSPVNANGNSADGPEVYFSQIHYENDKRNRVFFTVGEEESIEQKSTIQTNTYNCQCSFAFNRVPSTSAQLPEGVLRKILQRNFPESSKSIQRPGTSLTKDRKFGTFCPKCNGSHINGNYSGKKLLLETPTNATEVLRTCGTSSVELRGAFVNQSDSLDELLEDNNFIELPMPKSKDTSSSLESNDFKDSMTYGYSNTLLQRKMLKPDADSIFPHSDYMSGLIIQGLIKNIKSKEKKSYDDSNSVFKSSKTDDWLSNLHCDINLSAKYPMFDESISEALCIVADTDNWQVGVISSTIPMHSSIVPVGMSRLVSGMLEAFVYVWTKHKSPMHCLTILESKMREMWLRSEALAEIIMTIDASDVNLASLTEALDLEAADIPLLIAVATTHSPQIAQKIGFSYN